MISLTLTRGFIKKLMDNSMVVRFLNGDSRDLCVEYLGGLVGLGGFNRPAKIPGVDHGIET